MCFVSLSRCKIKLKLFLLRDKGKASATDERRGQGRWSSDVTRRPLVSVNPWPFLPPVLSLPVGPRP